MTSHVELAMLTFSASAASIHVHLLDREKVGTAAHPTDACLAVVHPGVATVVGDGQVLVCALLRLATLWAALQVDTCRAAVT